MREKPGCGRHVKAKTLSRKKTLHDDGESKISFFVSR
jgi:hypothetical protein